MSSNFGTSSALAMGIFAMAVAGWLAYGSKEAFEAFVEGEKTLLKPDDPKVVAIGGAVYRANCAPCHGNGLEGEPDWQTAKSDGTMPAPPHDASGHTWHHSSQLLFDMTKYGVAEAAELDDYKSAMPAYQDVLADDEIVAVLSFIKSTWPDDIRRQHEQLDKASR